MNNEELYDYLHEEGSSFERDCPRCKKYTLDYIISKEWRDYGFWNIDLCYFCNQKEGNVKKTFDEIDRINRKKERDYKKKMKPIWERQRVERAIYEENERANKAKASEDWWNDMWSMW